MLPDPHNADAGMAGPDLALIHATPPPSKRPYVVRLQVAVQPCELQIVHAAPARAPALPLRPSAGGGHVPPAVADHMCFPPDARIAIPIFATCLSHSIERVVFDLGEGTPPHAPHALRWRREPTRCTPQLVSLALDAGDEGAARAAVAFTIHGLRAYVPWLRSRFERDVAGFGAAGCWALGVHHDVAVVVEQGSL
jgi:hypothetical protein